MGKKKTEKTEKKPKPKKEYIYDNNVKCPNCEEFDTEFKNGELICKVCKHIISGIVISGTIFAALYFIF
jgi:ribosomal protein S27E